MHGPVILTRRAGADNHLSAHLKRAGIASESWPASSLETVDLAGGRLALLAALDTADAVAFPSPAAVEFTSSLLPSLEAALQGLAMVAAQGPGTASALRHHGVMGQISVAEKTVAEGLAAALGNALPRGSSVLLLQGNLARPNLAVALRSRGLVPRCLEIYRNRPPRGLVRPRQPVAAVVFCSPSAAERHLQSNPWMANAPAVAIGPTTAAATRALGHSRVVMAATPTSEGILTALQEVLAD